MKKRLFIEGMSCQHCVNRVTNALKSIDGVTGVKVDLKKKVADVDIKTNISDDVFKEVIDDAGYDLNDVQSI